MVLKSQSKNCPKFKEGRETELPEAQVWRDFMSWWRDDPKSTVFDNWLF